MNENCPSLLLLPGLLMSTSPSALTLTGAQQLSVSFVLVPSLHMCMHACGPVALPILAPLAGPWCISLPPHLPCLPRRWRLLAACFAVWHLQTLQGSSRPADVCTSPASCGSLLQHGGSGLEGPYGLGALPQPGSSSLAAPQPVFRPSGSVQLQASDPRWSAATCQPQPGPGPLRASSEADHSRRAAQLQAAGQRLLPGSDVWQLPQPTPQPSLLACSAQQQALEPGPGEQRWAGAGMPASGWLRGCAGASPTGSISANSGSVQPMRSPLVGAAEVCRQQPPSGPGRPAAGGTAARHGPPQPDTAPAQRQSAAAHLPQRAGVPQAGSPNPGAPDAVAERAAEWLHGAAAVITHSAAQKQELQQLTALLGEQQQLAARQQEAAQDLQRAADVCVAEQVAALHRFGQATHSGGVRSAVQPALGGRLRAVAGGKAQIAQKQPAWQVGEVLCGRSNEMLVGSCCQCLLCSATLPRVVHHCSVM